MLAVEKEKNVSLQADHNMEFVNLNLSLMETTAVALLIVDGIRWKLAVIRVNVLNVTTEHLINKKVKVQLIIIIILQQNLFQIK